MGESSEYNLDYAVIDNDTGNEIAALTEVELRYILLFRNNGSFEKVFDTNNDSVRYA